MKAKFWEYVNGGLVRITLAEDKPISWHESHSTDEGWSAESVTWSLNGETVTREWINDGVDCDGRITNYGRDECHIDDLNAREFQDYVTQRIDFIPAWRDVQHSQRDQFAELSNY